MAKRKHSALNPKSTVRESAMVQMNNMRAKANPRDFEDAIRKTGSGPVVRGIPTNAIQQNRWDK
jgi:hypothetical protein